MGRNTELLVKISKRTKDGVESWEGTTTLPGLTPAKVAKSKTTESKFSTRSALATAATRLAARYGLEVKFEGVGTEKTEKGEKPRRTSKKSETPAATTESVEA